MDRLDRDLRQRTVVDAGVRDPRPPVRGARPFDPMAELADAVAHSRSRVTHTIARLEREGHRRARAVLRGRPRRLRRADRPRLQRARAGRAHPRPRRPRLPDRECRPARTRSHRRIMDKVQDHCTARSSERNAKKANSTTSDLVGRRSARRARSASPAGSVAGEPAVGHACGRAASSPRRSTLLTS